ncbi:hypothetical protein FRB94_003606 [Tulasnella sp. JGI-2019a]|nr:hypothetical protein FRB94_003606 [Tulasnella sp. JGI-2019a]
MSTVTVADTVASTMSQYTDHPEQGPGMVYPDHGAQFLTTFVVLLGITVLTYCFARRSDYEGIWTLKGLKEIPWARLCVMIIFADSWAFIFCTGLLVNGAGLSTSFRNCSMAIFSCIFLYVTSKLLIYLFLIEKVYIVWAPHGAGEKTSRRNTRVWVCCMIMLAPLVAIVSLMIWGRVAMLRDDRVCIIGLARAASLSTMSYDLVMIATLTGLFVWPLFKGDVGPRLRRVAARTLVASFIALTTSCVNMIVLTLMHGKQLGWVCLASCGTDVSINAIAIYWVTDSSHAPRPLKESSSPPQTRAPNSTSMKRGTGYSVRSGPASGLVVEDGDQSKGAIHVSSVGSSQHLHHHQHVHTHSISILTNQTVNDGAVPANIAAGRVTRFAQELSTPGSRAEVDSEPKARGGLAGLIDALRGRAPPERREVHSMVHVTTTIMSDHGLQLQSAKYPPSEESDEEYRPSEEPKRSNSSNV